MITRATIATIAALLIAGSAHAQDTTDTTPPDYHGVAQMFRIDASPEQDLKEFREYFKKRFPKTPFEDFVNGGTYRAVLGRHGLKRPGRRHDPVARDPGLARALFVMRALIGRGQPV